MSHSPIYLYLTMAKYELWFDLTYTATPFNLDVNFFPSQILFVVKHVSYLYEWYSLSLVFVASATAMLVFISLGNLIQANVTFITDSSLHYTVICSISTTTKFLGVRWAKSFEGQFPNGERDTFYQFTALNTFYLFIALNMFTYLQYWICFTYLRHWICFTYSTEHVVDDNRKE